MWTIQGPTTHTHTRYARDPADVCTSRMPHHCSTALAKLHNGGEYTQLPSSFFTLVAPWQHMTANTLATGHVSSGMSALECDNTGPLIRRLEVNFPFDKDLVL